MAKQKQTREAADIAAMLERMMRAMVRRAGEGDLEALRELHRLQGVIGEKVTEAGGAAYATGHYSWTDIAGEVGMTRQAARQRFAGAAEAAA